MLFSYVDNFELQEKMMVNINKTNIKLNIELNIELCNYEKLTKLFSKIAITL